MPKIQIEIPTEAYEKLKKFAKEDERSLTKYITRGLIYLANIDGGYHTITTITPSINIMPTEVNGRKIKSIVYEKEKDELTPEEQSLEQQKINLQQDKILKQREKKWFKRAQEVMEDYWNDEQCQYFAHTHIYGDNIYLSYPEDPIAVHPEPDDSRLEDFLKIEKSYYNTLDTSDLWDGYYDELQGLIKEPYPNNYYEKIVNYCLNNNLYKDLKDILNYPSKDNLKYNYDDIIFAALEIPTEHSLTDNEWHEIAGYLTPPTYQQI